MRIPISEIKINPERRKADPAHIKELSKSIADVGLLNPITVNEDHTLIAGLHRLEAAKLLGWTEIECTVCGIDSIRAELAEIDENVIRRNLTNTELNDLLARRKKLYETLHPETIARNRPGHVSNHQGSSDKLSPESRVKSFVEDTAEKLGVSTRTVERHLYLAEHLTPKVCEILKKMDKQPPRCELMKLARLEPGQQEECAALFMSGEIKSVDTYLKQGKLETSGFAVIVVIPTFSMLDLTPYFLKGINNYQFGFRVLFDVFLYQSQQTVFQCYPFSRDIKPRWGRGVAQQLVYSPL